MPSVTAAESGTQTSVLIGARPSVTLKRAAGALRKESITVKTVDSTTIDDFRPLPGDEVWIGDDDEGNPVFVVVEEDEDGLPIPLR